jgi:hypothetical protein
MPFALCALLSSFDHPVGPRQDIRRYRQADLLRGLEINHELKLCRLFDWQVGWFGAF